MTDAQIASQLSALYDYTKSPSDTMPFDYLDSGVGPRGICWALKRVDGVDYVLFRGSATPWDWFKDLLAVADPYIHESFGAVHQGFALGMDRCWRDIKAHTTGPYVVAGHSLGAARATYLCGLMLESMVMPLRRVVFGEPKVGFQMFSDIVAVVPAKSYRNGDDEHHDLVTDVPFRIPPFLLYTHPTPLTNVCCQPETGSRRDLFAWHHMGMYEQALAG